MLPKIFVLFLFNIVLFTCVHYEQHTIPTTIFIRREFQPKASYFIIASIDFNFPLYIRFLSITPLNQSYLLLELSTEIGSLFITIHKILLLNFYVFFFLIGKIKKSFLFVCLFVCVSVCVPFA